MSKASDVALALTAVLQTITTVNGFNTNIGLRVFRGRGAFEPDEMPLTILVEAEDRVEDQKRSQVKIAQRYIAEGHDNCDPLNPNDKAHLMLADLKRAVFAYSETIDPLGNGLIKSIKYIGRTIAPRPDGQAFVSASIEFECVFVEDLKNP